MTPNNLIPMIGVVTDIRTDTPDIKTFRVEAIGGGKCFFAAWISRTVEVAQIFAVRCDFRRPEVPTGNRSFFRIYRHDHTVIGISITLCHFTELTQIIRTRRPVRR